MFDKNEKMTMNEIQRRFPRVYRDNVMLDNLNRLSTQYEYYRTMIMAFLGLYQPQDYQAKYQAYVQGFDEREHSDIVVRQQLPAFEIVWDGVNDEHFQWLEYSRDHRLACAKICSFSEGWDMYYYSAEQIFLASASRTLGINANNGLTAGLGDCLAAAGIPMLTVSDICYASPGWQNFWTQHGRLDVGQVITPEEHCYFISDYVPPDTPAFNLECSTSNAAGTKGYTWYVYTTSRLAVPRSFKYCNGDWVKINGITSSPIEINRTFELNTPYDCGRVVSAFTTNSLFAPLFRKSTAAQVMTYEQFVAEQEQRKKYEMYTMTFQPSPITRKVEVGDIVRDLHVATDGVHILDTGAIDFARVCDFASGGHMDKVESGEYPGRRNEYTLGAETIEATGEVVGVDGEYVVSAVYPNSAYWRNTYILDGVEWRNIAIGDTIKGTTKMKYEAMQYSRLVLDFADEYVANEFLYGNKTGTLSMLYVVGGDGNVQGVEIKDGASVSLPTAREVVEINEYNPIYGLLRVDTVTKPLSYDAWVSAQG